MRIAAAYSYGYAVYCSRLKQAAPSTHFQSAGEVLEEILAEEPQVVAFGEIHPQSLGQSITGIFTDEILPALAEGGITELVLEALFYDPTIEQDLVIFYKTGRLNEKETPALLANIELYTDEDLIKSLLFKARELGIRVHPGGLSRETAQATIFRPDFSTRDELRLRAQSEITQNILHKINHLLDQGRRVAVFSGRRHNDIHPTPADSVNGVNFGTFLQERLGNAYFEVDLMRGNNIRSPIRPEDVPQDGVNIFQEDNSYTLVFPQ
jgi:hypothetical protein